MKILAIDTSAKSASVAVTENGEIKGEFFINTMLTHSETLMPMIDGVLKNTKISIRDIDCFAVNCGPGSFTGLRIGIAAVKGLAYALNKPCAGVSTLESMTYNFMREKALICAVMDARCSQVYNALFDISGAAFTRVCEDRAVRIEELEIELKQYDRDILLVGDGAKLCYDKLRKGNNRILLANESVRFQRASGTAFAAELLAQKGELITANELMPKYLRLPQAQRELIAKQKNTNGGTLL
ncbi:MAG: tRNA (adenosine(37)-N6)-threonylcarbamoyltransferase complex dimerization subunit type 1 TsaB [Clostridia bacterium]|nr:tRNA (adenosine(37)-N6)-threonylcarbamoyltransferase complex dimerization subunit type 1 TsaB [Clostridia bacterium]